MNIGETSLDNPFILAPLAGYTDLPFRLLCRRHGAGLCYSEMISSNGLVYRQKNTIDLLASVAEERPVAMQLFGNDPAVMADAAAILSEYPVDIIDINMGCPVRKVVRKGAGAALMKEPDHAARIIAAVRRATSLPLTVKIRTGWSHDRKNAVAFARMAEENGADAVTVHGRTWSDGFGGSVDLATIAQVKQGVGIPVIGNGDILSHRSGMEMMRQTGVDAVMIGRGALGAPWIFADSNESPSIDARLQVLLEHLRLIEQYGQPQYPIARFKNHAGRYFKGSPHAARIRKDIYGAASFAELREMLAGLVRWQQEG